MLGPKAHLARSDKQANKPRRLRENFGAFFKHFEPFQWVRRISPRLARRQLKERPSRVSCRATRRAEPLAEKALFSGADGGRSASVRQKCRGGPVSPP